MKNIANRFIIQRATQTHRLVKKIDLALSIHGISFTEFMILHHLNAAPRRTMRRIDLAEAVGLSASGVTRLLAPMEKIKLVEKEASPRDARVSLVRLSAPGKSIYKDASKSFTQTAKLLTARLKPRQLQHMMELAEQLAT